MKNQAMVAFLSNHHLMKVITLLSSCSILATAMRVAVTGTTGRLGREAVQLLSSRGISTQCLLRHPIDASINPSISKDASSSQVASYLSSLPGVTMIEGDATNATSCKNLIRECDAVLALHGPIKPSPFQSLFRLLPESDPKHSKSVNYVAVQNLINAVKESSTCKRIVRVTGKGEDPFGIFSILINMLGNMAKGWNYEGEQLLRNSDVDYTIVRPGVMGRDDVPSGKVLALADNGGDMPVSAVTHSQIADLCVGCLDHPNTARATLTAMNVEEGNGEETYIPLLEKVTADRRVFPSSLLGQHKRGARIGAAVLATFVAAFFSTFITMVKTVKSFLIQ